MIALAKMKVFCQTFFQKSLWVRVKPANKKYIFLSLKPFH